MQGQGRRAGPSPWRMAGWPSGHSPGEFPDLSVSWTVSSKWDLQTYWDGAVCEAGLGSEPSCQDSAKGGRGPWIPPYSPGKLSLSPPFLVGSSLCLVSSKHNLVHFHHQVNFIPVFLRGWEGQFHRSTKE